MKKINTDPTGMSSPELRPALAAPAQPAQSAPDALRVALETIAEWKLPASGRTWPQTGEPMSYGAAFGSNGERGYMREIARAALAAAPAAPASAQPTRRPNCDDSGDVTSITGEWRGTCHCPAGKGLQGAQEAQPVAWPQGPSVEALMADRQMLLNALDGIDRTACCNDWAGMNESRRRFAIARDARIAIERSKAALANAPEAPQAAPLTREPLKADSRMPHAVNVPGYGFADAKAVRAIERYYGIGAEGAKR